MNARTFPLIRRIAGRVAAWREMRESVRTEMLIAELPPYLRKDIGWPDSPRQRGSRR